MGAKYLSAVFENNIETFDDKQQLKSSLDIRHSNVHVSDEETMKKPSKVPSVISKHPLLDGKNETQNTGVCIYSCV